MQTTIDDKRPLLIEHPLLQVSEIYVLLWSQSQNALHVETLDATFKSNADAFLEERRMDYVPLIIGDRDVVDEMAMAVRPTLSARHEARECEQLALIPHEEMP